MKRLVVIALFLASCVNGHPDANNTVAAMQSGYAASVAAEIAYEQSGQATPQVIRQIEEYRVAAQAALNPLVQAVENNTPIEAAALTSATTTLQDLTDYLQKQNLMKVPQT